MESPLVSLELSQAALLRILRPLLAEAIARHIGRLPPAAEVARWPADLSLGAEGLGLGLDGLIDAAAAASRLFHLHERSVQGHLVLHPRLGDWARIVGDALGRGVSAFSFAAPGGAGWPVLAPRPLRRLLDEADGWAHALRDRQRVVLAVPAHEAEGCLFGVLVPRALGLPVIDRRGSLAGDLLRDLKPGDLLVANPSILQALATTAHRLPADVLALSAAVAEQTAAALEALGLSELVETTPRFEPARRAA